MTMKRTLMAATCVFALTVNVANAQQANPLSVMPGVNVISKIPGLGGIFGGGPPPALLEPQLLQQAEALLQTKAQLEMLMGLGLDNSPAILVAINNIHGLLGQIEMTLGYDPASVVGEIDRRYPLEYGRPLTLPETIERRKEWNAARWAAIAESHKVQAQITSDMPAAAERDAATLGEAIASPGLRASQDAGNQLSASIAEELRKSQMLQIASMRAMEKRELEEASATATSNAAFCGFMASAGSPYQSRACNGSN